MNIGMYVRMGSIGLVLGGLLLMAGCGSGDESAVAQSSGAIDVSGVTQNWDKHLPAAQRFVVLASFNSEAVRDNETGLVWELAPVATEHTWSLARAQCTSRTTGGRKGWRLPSVHELASLVDPSVAAPGPTLPAGHPFTNVLSTLYWSASTNAEFPTFAWVVGFDDGVVGSTGKANDGVQVWCVRGGMNAEAY
jgi:hypothetical protein